MAITYTQSTEPNDYPLLTVGGTRERAMVLVSGSTAGDNTSDEVVGSATSRHAFTFLTTSTGTPGSSAWPNASYKCQLDVTSAGADITYGLLALGGATGYFGRYTSAAGTVEQTPQSELAFAGTGLKLATKTWTPTTGDIKARYVVVVAAQNTAAMAQNLGVQLGNGTSQYIIWGEVTVAGDFSGFRTMTGVGV